MNQNIGISDMTIGIDGAGMENYIESLRVKLITEIFNDIDTIDDIESAINAGWQGAARDKFMDSFEDERRNIKSDLEYEFNNLKARLVELKSTYYEQDEKMMDL